MMGDAKQVRTACIRAGYIMPPATDKINTGTFVRGVMNKSYWMLTREMAVQTELK